MIGWNAVKSIVVIDDEPSLRRLISVGLGRAGFSVIEAADGTAGLALCVERPPALVLCDLRMPGLDGFETLRRLRADPRTAAVPVILMTGSTDGAGMRRGMELGADDFILKPFHLDDVSRAVESRLARQKELEARAEQRLSARRDGLGTTLSHELRTPLNAVLGYASLLVEEGGTLARAEVIEMAQAILRAGERLDRLVERQLAYSEVELLSLDRERLASLAGPPLDDGAVIVADVARRVAGDASRAGDLALETVAAPARLPQAHLSRIARELVDNAFKFSTRGSPVRVTVGPGDLGSFLLEVEDAGSGMTAEQIAAIGAYVQFDRRRREQQGLGLGLALARTTAELWGGALELDSGPGRGTRVTVRLPA